MNEEKLKEVLEQMRQNLNAIKNSIEDHTHDSDGDVEFSTCEIPTREDVLFDFLYKDDIGIVFEKEKPMESK